MGLFRKAQPDPYAGNGYYDVEPMTEASLPSVEPSEKAPGSTLNIGGNNMELKVLYPTAFCEVPAIADALMSGCTAFLNLEATDREVCRRLMDFVSGVAYCIDGNIKKVAGATYIVSPSSVDVSETDEASVGAIDPGL
jgi:cell division inhibitor SepF